MKKLVAGAISLLLAAGCWGCGTTEQDDTLRVVATVFPSYDFAQQIVGENAEVTLLLTPGAESHAYEPTASDLSKIQRCDVFLYIGGESEVWVDEILESVDTSDMKIVRLMDAISPLEEELKEGMEAEEAHDHAEDAHEEEETEYDEHIWASIPNAEKMATAIETAVAAADPVNAAAYHTAAAAYQQQLAALDQRYRDMVAEATNRVLVFGDRFPFRYMTEEYGLDYYAAFVGCSSETEASPATLSFLITKVQDEQIRIVFYTENSSKKIAERMQEATGCELRMLHSCNNITKEEQQANATYLSLMEENLAVLSEALQVS